MWAGLFYADGRTDVQTEVTKLSVAFRNFANVPKNASVAAKSLRKVVGVSSKDKNRTLLLDIQYIYIYIYIYLSQPHDPELRSHNDTCQIFYQTL
jgi:hypothetical protein